MEEYKNIKFNHKEKSLAESFGISTERKDALNKKICSSITGHMEGAVSEDLERLLKEAQSPAEALYIAFKIGTVIEMISAKMSMLGAFLGH